MALLESEDFIEERNIKPLHEREGGSASLTGRDELDSVFLSYCMCLWMMSVIVMEMRVVLLWSACG